MIEYIEHALLHSLEDVVNIISFLFLVFLFIEFIEHSFSHKKLNFLNKSKTLGPLSGAILGIFPQCGFSIAITNLYLEDVVSMGTLVAVYLATSDEMLPIMISKGTKFSLIITVLIVKLSIAIIFGYIIDMVFKNEAKVNNKLNYKCDCQNKNLLLSVLLKTLKICFILLITNFFITLCFEIIGEEIFRQMMNNFGLFAPFISALFGLIPNCASSVIITELFLENIISFGTMIAGLLVGCGLGWIILFKENKNIKNSLIILIITYFIGAISGFLINIFNLI